MRNVLVLGGGKIGSLISLLLAECGGYSVFLADIIEIDPSTNGLDHDAVKIIRTDVTDRSGLQALIDKTPITAIVSALPYYCNIAVAQLARDNHLHYLDLTEDVEVCQAIESLSQSADQAFIPQCGLAPGMISIIANNLMDHFDTIDTVKMRVGALPVHPSNALKYSLTWSTDGLINEYGNRCVGVEDGEMVSLLPLEGYETIELDGLLYEAFNTSGGLGTLAETYRGKVQHMNYKTLRYPGHCEKIHLLMQDLKLNEDRDTLKRILENAIPKTLQDVALIYVSVSGYQQGELFEENYVKKIYPTDIGGKLWSAIQVTTASGICAVLDLLLSDGGSHRGFVTQESFSLEEVLANRFGKHYI